MVEKCSNLRTDYFQILYDHVKSVEKRFARSGDHDDVDDELDEEIIRSYSKKKKEKFNDTVRYTDITLLEENGRGKCGFMNLTPTTLLSSYFPTSDVRAPIEERIIDANRNGYSHYIDTAHLDTEEGGNNVPVSINCQIVAAFKLCSLIRDHSLSGFLRVRMSHL